MRNFKFALGAFFLAAICFTSCLNEPKLKELTPTLAVPIADSKLSVYDILARADSNELVIIDTSGLLSLRYESDLLTVSAQDIVQLPNVNQNFQVIPGATNVPPSGQKVELTGTENVDLNFGNIDLHEMNLKEGNVTFNFTSSIPNDVLLVFTFPDVKKGGVAQSVQASLNYTGSPVSAQVELDLAGADFDFAASGTPNQLRVNYKMEVTSKGNNIAANDGIDVDASFNNLQFGKLRYVSTDIDIDLPADSVLIRVFKNSTLSNLEISYINPSVDIHVESSVSSPISLLFEKLQMLEVGENGNLYDIDLTGISNPASINYPPNSNQTASTDIHIGANESNIEQIFTPVKKELIHDLAVNLSTPGGEINEIADHSKIDVKVVANLPLELTLSNWTLEATVPLDFPGEQTVVKNGSIRLLTSNMFPVDVKTQVYFLDANRNLIDSLFANEEDSRILESAGLDANGRSAVPTDKVIDIAFPDDKLTRLLNAEFVTIKGTVATGEAENNKKVRIYENNYIDVKLGLKAQFNDILNQ